MGAGLVVSYGTLAGYAGQYLYPAGDGNKGWQFLAVAGEVKMGESLDYTLPSGAKITVARQGQAGTVDDFIALSSVCPHLGCKVHWEGNNDRFFCPCHNGAFSPEGKGIEGPPGEAGQSLLRYPLKIESGLLFIEVPLTSLQTPSKGEA